MERFILQDLIAWKNRSDRKPLILLGARQVGKTYILKEFGRREFENVAYINCDNKSRGELASQVAQNHSRQQSYPRRPPFLHERLSRARSPHECSSLWYQCIFGDEKGHLEANNLEDTRILVIFATSKTKTLWEKGCNYRLNMMEQKKYNQIDTKTPDIQNMILSYQIGGIAYELSQRLDISPSRALDLFYRSKTCKQLHDKRTGLYLMSNGYVADDFILEMQGRN